MTVILAIDPGPVQSAWLELNDAGSPERFALQGNEELLVQLRLLNQLSYRCLVIEKVESFGMAVGAEVFETVWWSGQFAEAAHPLRVDRIGRKVVKIQLCGSMRAKDPNIRAALIDRFGGPLSIKKGGALHGVKGDIWSALAVAVAYSEGAR